MSSETLEFEVLTIFPGAIEAFVNTGIMGKAIERNLVAVHCTDLRRFTHDRHRSVDDTPFGGGPGMVIKAAPVVEALESVIAERGPVHTILLTPSGVPFDQRVAERLAELPRIALLCGRYEGIDDRVREHWVDECLSIGDFVLNGGEVAAAVVIEAVARLREGVLGNPDSIAAESFAAEGDDSDDWQLGVVLEHPHYTRPASFRELPVPPILLGGDHQAIERWRRRAACLRTWALRPELRPRSRLPPGHPIVLAIPSDTEGEVVAELASLAGEHGTQLAALGPDRVPGALHMRDLKQLERALRKRHGRDPWTLGVSDAAEAVAERGPRLVIDVLAFEDQQAPAPLLLWLGGSEHPALRGRPLRAWLALADDHGESRISPNRLALASALIDISQPQAAHRSVVPLARAVLRAMRDDGLLGP